MNSCHPKSGQSCNRIAASHAPNAVLPSTSPKEDQPAAPFRSFVEHHHHFVSRFPTDMATPAVNSYVV
jgi:hypothetical protein